MTRLYTEGKNDIRDIAGTPTMLKIVSMLNFQNWMMIIADMISVLGNRP